MKLTILAANTVLTVYSLAKRVLFSKLELGLDPLTDRYHVNYAIIGLGKLGSHLSHLLTLNSVDHQTFKREDSKENLGDFDIILLCLPDSKIFEFYQAHPQIHDKTCIHFSGALYFEEIIGIHPLMSFSTTFWDQEVYQKIHWVIDHEIKVSSLLPINEKKVSLIEPHQKSYYHALAVLGGNIPALLWKKIESELKVWGITQEDFHLYLKMSMAPYFENQPLTGPIARHDTTTIEQNIASIKQQGLKKIYQGILEI